jgi:hypothetical protein
MTDPADIVDGFADEIAGGVVVEFEPVGGSKVNLRARYDEELLASGEYAEIIRNNDRGRTNRGEFRNNVADSVEEIEGLDADDVKSALRRWFEAIIDEAEEEEIDIVSDEAEEIINGTHTPVEIHGGEETTWEVELTYAGRTNTLEFTTGEMRGGPGALGDKIANYYFELIEIEKEDWESIRDYWNDHSEVVAVVDETGRDAVAERFVNKIQDAVRPLEDLEQVPTDPSGAWYDPDNSGNSPDAPPDVPVLWVQSRFFGDKLEAIGKQIEYKGQLTKDLINEGVLYGSSIQRTWDGVFEKRTRMFPFDPRELGIDEDDVAPAPGDNTDEVEP